MVLQPSLSQFYNQTFLKLDRIQTPTARGSCRCITVKPLRLRYPCVVAVFKMMILLKKNPAFTNEEFVRYWLETHAPLAKKMPGLRRYVVNVVRRPPGREPDYHGVVELWFDDHDSMKKAFNSPEGAATQKDTEAFTSGLTTMYIDEQTII